MSESAPLYERVKRHITDGIVSGEFEPGMRLPSESDLVQSLSVSRMTVNRALRELSRDGLIVRHQGLGSFVSKTTPNTLLSEVRDIRDIIAERGGQYSCTVLEAVSVPLDAVEADLFALAPGTGVWQLVTVHRENCLPLQLERRLVRADFAPALLDEDFNQRSLFRYLQAIAPVSELEHVVEAATPDRHESEQLQLGDHEPVLRLRRRTWVGERVVTLGYFTHPGERYRVAVRVRPSDVARS